MSVIARKYVCLRSSPVLSADLIGNASLLADFSTEAGNFLHDKLLHPIDGIFLLKAKVKDL